jgi:hypothetical protein
MSWSGKSELNAQSAIDTKLNRVHHGVVPWEKKEIPAKALDSQIPRGPIPG